MHSLSGLHPIGTHSLFPGIPTFHGGMQLMPPIMPDLFPKMLDLPKLPGFQPFLPMDGMPNIPSMPMPMNSMMNGKKRR
jgi:hypothetical protein